MNRELTLSHSINIHQPFKHPVLLCSPCKLARGAQSVLDGSVCGTGTRCFSPKMCFTEKTNEHFNKKPGNVTNHAGSQTQSYLLSNFHGDKNSAAQLQSLSYCWDQRSWSIVLTTIPGHVCCFKASFQSFISTSVVSRNKLGTPK